MSVAVVIILPECLRNDRSEASLPNFALCTAHVETRMFP